MHHRILKAKLLFLHHLTTLPADTLAREIYEVQKELQLPGLIKECECFLVNNGITRIDVLSQSVPSKKLNYQQLKNESCKRKAYLSKLTLSEARLRFKLKYGITPTIMMNFPSDQGFANQLWMCSV